MNEAVVVMKTGLSLLIIVALLSMARGGATEPLVVRCMGENISTLGDASAQGFQTHLDIVVPETLDRLLATASREGANLGPVDPWLIGLGEIEITVSLGEQHSLFKRTFIVTQIPTPIDSTLVGFYKINSYIQTLQADLWKQGKPFVLFDARNKQVVAGHCQ
jgi:hypothetical protein